MWYIDPAQIQAREAKEARNRAGLAFQREQAHSRQLLRLRDQDLFNQPYPWGHHGSDYQQSPQHHHQQHHRQHHHRQHHHRQHHHQPKVNGLYHHNREYPHTSQYAYQTYDTDQHPYGNTHSHHQQQPQYNMPAHGQGSAYYGSRAPLPSWKAPIPASQQQPAAPQPVLFFTGGEPDRCYYTVPGYPMGQPAFMPPPAVVGAAPLSHGPPGRVQAPRVQALVEPTSSNEAQDTEVSSAQAPSEASSSTLRQQDSDDGGGGGASATFMTLSSPPGTTATMQPGSSTANLDNGNNDNGDDVDNDDGPRPGDVLVDIWDAQLNPNWEATVFPMLDLNQCQSCGIFMAHPSVSGHVCGRRRVTGRT